MSRQERHIPFPTKVASGALVAFALVAGACASKAGGPEKNPNTQEPTATRVSQLETATSQSPTPEPEATATAKEDPAAIAKDLTAHIAEIQNQLIKKDFPDLLDTAKSLENDVKEDDPRNAQGIINTYGLVANEIQYSVCNGVTQPKVIETWFLIEKLINVFGARKEDAGQLPAGGTNVLVGQYFGNPQCPELLRN